MSVAEISTNGELVSNVNFGERDGQVIHIKSNATSICFFKRRGVYFMKLYAPKSKIDELHLGRPGDV